MATFMKIENGHLLCKVFFLRLKYTDDKMRFQKSVFLLRWALNLAFALVAFGGKTCDGLDVLGLLGVCGGGVEYVS